ncbi:hypothetical protein [Janthinobacterium sp. PAMC25594]|uniref:hypothetical protein n=1 Tax=Janthinobacterium sp. PAMC25594 TaxID=2861284 RepID=UPI001C62AC02|nr:hypothetical protein [Janthinobacterium sp. PAMC25594]QYG08106.1 hypothetical protein KY494_04720 [Janthinobacterium sp. PAMC25594]
MSSRSPAPAPETPAEAAYKLDRAVLRAIHTCQPVLFEGKQQHLRGMSAQVLGGGVSSVIYLMGDATPHQPNEITFLEKAE